jgi:hypothetical protein
MILKCKPIRRLKVTAHSLRVRDIPNLDGNIIGALPQNSIVECLEQSEDSEWYKIAYEVIRGLWCVAESRTSGRRQASTKSRSRRIAFMIKSSG